jgi:hypothetical protein
LKVPGWWRDPAVDEAGVLGVEHLEVRVVVVLLDLVVGSVHLTLLAYHCAIQPLGILLNGLELGQILLALIALLKWQLLVSGEDIQSLLFTRVIRLV